MIGKSISQYKILEKLGEGGMGEVYLAEDTELHRKIALKFLPPQYTKNEELNTRFKREARTAAALNHPNIITIHEVGEFEGKTFIAMEYVEGESLRQQMTTHEMSTEQVLDYITQICAGLSKAHDAGIIHRDLKPENIVVDRDGRLRILDFGLAKFAAGTKLTRHSSTLGTLSYMSPEQFESSNVDQRTDIWSLGVMLYEMLAGHTPFEGDYEAAVMYSIMNESPEPVSTQSKKMLAGLDGVVDRALAKSKEDRYVSADEFIEDLKQILGDGAGSGPPVFLTSWRLKRLLRRPIYITLAVLLVAGAVFSFRDQLFSREPIRIAVLPFEGVELVDEDQAKVGGLWQESLNNLQRLKQVRPLTRDIVKRYKGSDYDPIEFKNRFGQDFVLRTQARKREDEYVFTAYLTDLEDFAEVWRYEFTSGTLNFKAEYTSQIYTALGLEARALERAVIQKKPTEHPEAYAFYLQAQNSFQSHNFDQALQMYDKALQLDSTFALAHAGKSFIHWARVDGGLSNDTTLFRLAEIEATRAVELDPQSADAHGFLAHVYMMRGKKQDGYQATRKGLELDSNSVWARSALINVYFNHGLLEKAEETGRDILKDEPLNIGALFRTGNMIVQQGRVEEGLRFHQRSLEFYPDHPYLLRLISWCYMALGRLEEARSVMERALDLYPNFMHLRLTEILLLATEGRVDEARQRLTPQMLEYAKVDAIRARWTKMIYAELGDIDEALYWFKRQIDFGYENYPEMAWDPLIDNMRDDPRFQEIMHDLQVRWKQYRNEIK